MKKTDIALVILLAGISFAVSYWLGGMFLGDPSEDTYSITYVDAISSSLEEPDLDTFNPTGLNPTVEVIIGKCKEGEAYDNTARKCVPTKKDKTDSKSENSKSGSDDSGEDSGSDDTEE